MLHYYWCKHCLYYPVWTQICLDLFIFSVFVCSSPVTGYNWSAWGSISILPPSAACIVDLDPAMCDTSVSHPSGWEKKTCRQIPLQAHRRRSKPCTAHLVRELNSSPDFSWVSFQWLTKNSSLPWGSGHLFTPRATKIIQTIISAAWDNVAREVEASDGNNLHECVANCWLGAQQNGMLSIQCFFPPPSPQYQLL